MFDSCLPQPFPTRTLAQVASRITDGSHFSPIPQRQGPLIANVKDMKSGRIDFDSCTRISSLAFRELKATGCVIKSGDVLLSKDGTVGRVVVYESDQEIGALSSICLITPQPGQDARFLGHALQSHESVRQYERAMSGSALRRLVLRDIRQIRVPTPAGDEQVRVALILDTLDTTIRQTEAIIEKLKQVKQGLLHDLLTRGIDANGELRPPQSQAPHLYKESPLGWIPRGWSISRVGEEVDVRHGFAFPGHLFSSEPKGYRLLVPGNFSRFGGLDFSDGNTKYFDGQHPAGTLLEDGEALIVMTDLSPMTLILGRAVLLNEGFPVLHNQRIGKFVFRRSSDWYTQFFVMLMNDDRLRSKVIAEATGTTVRHTSPDRIKAGIVAKPSIEEQTAIAHRLDALLVRVRAEAAYTSKLRQLKSGLMDDLLTGRVRVTPLLADSPPTN